MLDESIVRRVIGEAAGKGSDLAELFVEDKRSQALKLEDRRI